MDTSCTKYHLKVILDARYSRKFYRDEDSLDDGVRQLKGRQKDLQKLCKSFS